MNKKGQLGNLQQLIMVLVFIGILIGAGFLVMEEFRGAIPEGSNTEINETLTTVENETGETVTRATLDGFVMDTAPTCYNSSNGVSIGSGNITATSVGLIKSTSTNCSGDTSGFCNYDWKCTYDYDYWTKARQGVNKTIEAAYKIPIWLGIIVILVIVGILLVVLFNIFPTSGGLGFGKGKGGVSAEI